MTNRKATTTLTTAETGRYLQPDPLGYPDGPDAYLYAQGDPVNKMDPTGLYEMDIHYYMTFFLSIAAGVDYEAARTIALATQYVDNNEATRPVDGTNWMTTVGSIFVNQPKLLSYHFVLSNTDGKTVPASKNDNLSNPNSFQLDNLYSASLNAPTKCARFQFLGEYLHAFEDTFSHRNRSNIPYDALVFGLGLGHGIDGHDPDYTFNHGSWTVNEDRTFEMELEVFRKLQGYGDSGKAMDEIALVSVLKEFNAIQENDGNTGDFNPGNANNKKITLLNKTLADWGFTGLDLSDPEKHGYNVGKGAQNRENHLCDKDNVRLIQANYPGTILPTSACPS